jgi:parallel beta-helix repeat protein
MTYSVYVSSSSLYSPDDRTKVYDDIKDTFFIATDIGTEGEYFYKVEAKDGYKVTIGWDDHNSFIYRNGSQIPCEINSDLTLSKDDSPVMINCNVTIHEDAKLIIEEGTELVCSPDVMMMVYGSIEFIGSLDEPVKIYNPIENTSLFEIKIDNAANKCLIDHLEADNVILSADSSKLDISNAIFKIGDHIPFDGPTCRLEWGDYKVENCEIVSNGLTGGILLRHGKIIADSNSLYNVPDAIECDPCNDSHITNNTINISTDDGIDLNGSKNVIISGNEIFNVFDKGISIGSRFDVRSDSIEISRNIISGCKYGIALKTARNIEINNNTLWGNQINLELSNPDNLPIGTTADIRNTIMAGAVDQSFQKDDISEATISYTLSNDELYQGTGNIKAEPELKDPANKDFRLLPDSPCINAGDPESPKDPDGSRADIGAIPYLEQKGIVINEICYNPPDDRDCGDWVEFYNPTIFPIDMSNWYFNDSNDENIFNFPTNFRMLPDSYIVLSNDLQSFSTFYPEVTNVIGEFGFGFSGSGELLRLYDANGNLIDHVLYDDKEPWPEEADGNGPTLELISAELDNALPESWQSSLAYGTPGQKNSEHGSSAEEISLNDDIFITAYPNPVENVLYIRIENTNNALFSFYLVDQLGQRVNQRIEASNSNHFGIDLSKYSSGLYFLIIEMPTERNAMKIIKR